jgi:hypothetical protein
LPLCKTGSLTGYPPCSHDPMWYHNPSPAPWVAKSTGIPTWLPHLIRLILSTAATVKKAQQDATLRQFQQELKQSGGCTCYFQWGVLACRRPHL